MFDKSEKRAKNEQRTINIRNAWDPGYPLGIDGMDGKQQGSQKWFIGVLTK